MPSFFWSVFGHYRQWQISEYLLWVLFCLITSWTTSATFPPKFGAEDLHIWLWWFPIGNVLSICRMFWHGKWIVRVSVNSLKKFYAVQIEHFYSTQNKQHGAFCFHYLFSNIFTVIWYFYSVLGLILASLL